MNLSPTPTSSLKLKLLVLLLIVLMNYIYKFREDFDLKRSLKLLNPASVGINYINDTLRKF